MGVPRRNVFTSWILELVNPDFPVMPFETVYEFLVRTHQINRKQYHQTIRSLRNRNIISLVKKQNKVFIKFTKKGCLEVLLQKAKLPQENKNWDRKWRVLIFDIPEAFHAERDKFRKLLKANGFMKLQGSVFVSPYPLSREAIRYLGQVGLNTFIRIMKVEEMDNDTDLKKKFNL